MQDGVYPAIGLTTREVQIGDPVHILGFPGVVLSHELLNQNVTLEASATNGAVSGFKMDVINQDLVQTDAPAAHGNSGGPAVTDDATLVGRDAVRVAFGLGRERAGLQLPDPRAATSASSCRAPRSRSPATSKFNTVWAGGVEALLAQRYKVALRRSDRGQQARAEPDRREARARAGARRR